MEANERRNLEPERLRGLAVDGEFTRPLLLPSLVSALRAASGLLSDFVRLNCADEFGDAFDN
jgi:hypothetical protein